ncbi:hypothetical protein [Infirmifilum sp.]|uniref:hypothetical protein n=1 Tax=Infirmifilum sp. TaxID=2856575 RepID=UPI003D0C6742
MIEAQESTRWLTARDISSQAERVINAVRKVKDESRSGKTTVYLTNETVHHVSEFLYKMREISNVHHLVSEAIRELSSSFKEQSTTEFLLNMTGASEFYKTLRSTNEQFLELYQSIMDKMGGATHSFTDVKGVIVCEEKGRPVDPIPLVEGIKSDVSSVVNTASQLAGKLSDTLEECKKAEKELKSILILIPSLLGTEEISDLRYNYKSIKKSVKEICGLIQYTLNSTKTLEKLGEKIINARKVEAPESLKELAIESLELEDSLVKTSLVKSEIRGFRSYINKYLLPKAIVGDKMCVVMPLSKRELTERIEKYAREVYDGAIKIVAESAD